MTEPLNTVVLMEVASELEASIIVAALRDDDIVAEASGVLTSAFRAEAPGTVKILVRAEDLERAQATVADMRAARPDESEADDG